MSQYKTDMCIYIRSSCLRLMEVHRLTLYRIDLFAGGEEEEEGVTGETQGQGRLPQHQVITHACVLLSFLRHACARVYRLVRL